MVPQQSSSLLEHKEETKQIFKMLSQVTILVVIACVSTHPTYPAQTDSGYHTYPQPASAPEPEVNIDYKMSMAVQDDETANYQTREESKEGKIIKGSYTVLEPTGELRVVNYYADENGFQADVQNKAPAAPAYKPHYPKEDHYIPAAAPQYPKDDQYAPVAVESPELPKADHYAPVESPKIYAAAPVASKPTAAVPQFFMMSQPKVVYKSSTDTHGY